VLIVIFSGQALWSQALPNPQLGKDHCLNAPASQNLCFTPKDTLATNRDYSYWERRQPLEVFLHNRGQDTAWIDTIEIKIDTGKFNPWNVQIYFDPPNPKPVIGSGYCRQSFPKGMTPIPGGIRIILTGFSRFVPPRDSVKLHRLLSDGYAPPGGSTRPGSPGSQILVAPMTLMTTGSGSATLTLISWYSFSGTCGPTGSIRLDPNGPIPEKPGFRWNDGLGRRRESEPKFGGRQVRPSTIVYHFSKSTSLTLRSEKLSQGVGL